ncbi:MAG: hypothetical protein A2513_10565 [Sulfurimonas sp. RIFOXYD12_FULL_33_39]|uniref:DUF2393 domain-containing protein n=1 Tax=unclassified Sulfurimonas TaxID=2623549 RepID=UPI0008D50F6D|nr:MULTISPECIES: DUF2393 domain-containing protein [unclassified Sulfurimonas]OHE07258.1 MAG: hypothetical protein A3G74_00465 [Sulfurimonas sp. RIFCSPLOWO2_12_FULL_34_6]OHE09951.1 MAG: hypothetical protein A2513_10565 [Sulfurimonas sp. RIFOXYD12_FULL_33_39]OHE13928.1 MAG: hypothetical protein A2530_09190 [Sulfurimonas sp. RIFOXYD2_FULL_34_21]
MEIVTEFIKELIIYDYMLFGGVLVVFLLFMILGIVFRHKTVLALSLILFSFIFLIVGSIFGYIEMHKFLFKNTTAITSQKKLTFTKAVVIEGTIKNISKRDFQSCKITAKVYKLTPNEFKNYVLKLKPINKMSIIESDILKDEEREIKIIVEPFVYVGDYNITLGADCR